ncbi:hypothetical protein QQ045_016837 [Rhodiola kirilowii]
MDSMGETLDARSSAPDVAKAREQLVGAETIQLKSRNFLAAKTGNSRNRERGVPLKFDPQIQNADSVIIPTLI